MITTDSIGRFSIPLLIGAEDALGAGQVSVFLCDARDDPIREQYYLRTLLSRKVDGIIVTGRRTQARTPIARRPARPGGVRVHQLRRPAGLLGGARTRPTAPAGRCGTCWPSAAAASPTSPGPSTTTPRRSAPPPPSRPARRGPRPRAAAAVRRVERGLGPAGGRHPAGRRHRARRGLLRQRPDRPRRRRGAARGRPRHPRRRGAGRLRQLGRHGRRLPARADQRRHGPGGHRPVGRRAAARGDQRRVRCTASARGRAGWSRGPRRPASHRRSAPDRRCRARPPAGRAGG